MPNQSQQENPLHLPPFPPLVWQDGYAWEGTATLRAWAGFQSRRGPYASANVPVASDGTVTLTVMAPDDEPSLPSAEQAAAYRLLTEQQDALRETILAALLAEYPNWQSLYSYQAEEAVRLMPDMVDPVQFRTLIGLSTVYVLTQSKDGFAYAGFEFGCTWDEEHGVGVMTNAGRIVKLGLADTAFADRTAARDAEKWTEQAVIKGEADGKTGN